MTFLIICNFKYNVYNNLRDQQPSLYWESIIYMLGRLLSGHLINSGTNFKITLKIYRVAIHNF